MEEKVYINGIEQINIGTEEKPYYIPKLDDSQKEFYLKQTKKLMFSKKNKNSTVDKLKLYQDQYNDLMNKLNDFTKKQSYIFFNEEWNEK